ncbi:unnamed protein product [Adineta steineri]|uniref:Kinesin motor domain-containing protein n=2 Tax=Adineta steineri TaxID=433720 RepID=A0A813X163_9BILA|nr:unnamed protein product [Adineta steineri]CAF1481190.1 unnamed protein product [Adineta steineri]
MTKCLLKALKAVDLDKHIGLFRSLGYDSAGALAHFRTEHFEKLNFNEQELLHLISLLDVLKEATRDGKICTHNFSSTKSTQQQQQQSNIKSNPIIRAAWCDDTNPQKNSQSKRSKSSIDITRRSSIQRNYSDDFIIQKTSTVLSREHIIPTKPNHQIISGSKSFLNRPPIEHVKVKSYNYGIPTSRRSRSNTHRSNFQQETNYHHSPLFVSSPRHATDTISYAKPAEIYVYARKRPLLSNETNFEDTVTVPDNKRVIITENKANLDCTPLLKKTEFQYDQVFGSDISNKQVFESTVLPFISTDHRHNLTYICFGQTGSGKSHTIFGSKSTDGLLIYCTQLLLQEVNIDNKLICSFYEIYNNQVYDLINVGKRLFVREDSEHHVNVIGVTEVLLKNLDNLRCVIDNGLTRRHHGKSAFNSNSSRSHAVFQIILKDNYNSGENFRLIFIDLAGSERATDAQNNLRQTRREGAQINCSLLALKECIRSMDLTHSHAPFRQSKLTHILRDSLVGSKTRTCLMANVSPPSDCCQCSLNTLQYASRIRDISIRHRIRTMPIVDIQMNSNDNIIKEQEIAHDNPQRIFRPATASTPVHRLISSTDENIYMSRNQTDIDARKTKPLDIDWQIANDDIPITGGGDNHLLKTLASLKRDFKINSQTNNKQPINRLHQKKIDDNDESPSSYFPLPQSDIKKSSLNKTNKKPQLYENSRLMYEDGNERQWKPISSTISQRLSDPSIKSSNPTKLTHVAASTQLFDNKPYSNGTSTENLRTKTILNDKRHKKSSSHNTLAKSLNINKQYDIGKITKDIEPMIYSDRQTAYRDQTGFYTNRNELLSIVSSRLSTVGQRASSVVTPRKSRINSQNSIINSSQTNKSKNLISSSNKTRHKTRPIKSASSTTSIASDNPIKKSSFDNKKLKTTSSYDYQKFDPTIRHSPNRHQRTVPLRVHYSSDSEENDNEKIHQRKFYPSKYPVYSTRSEACQTTDDIYSMKNEQEQTEDYLLYKQIPKEKDTIKNAEQSSSSAFAPILTSLSSPALLSSTLTQAPLDSAKALFNYSSPPRSSTNVNNPQPTSSSFSSPSKDFALRVSDQLSALRTLLETHLVESNEIKRSTKDSLIFQSSPGTFAKDFLKSYRQPSVRSNSTELLTDTDDDDKEVARNFHNNNTEKPLQYESDLLSSTNPPEFLSKYQYEQIIQPSLSSLSSVLNQIRANSSDEPPSISNLAVKIDTKESSNLLNQNDENNAINKNNSMTTSDSEHTSQVNSALQNPFTKTSSDGSYSHHSLIRSPIHVSSYDITNRKNHDHEHLIDHSKSNSFLTTSPFDTLLNSLKVMREKDLDFVVHTGDDKLIPVAE